jgi:hypothetical protein
MTGIFCGKLFRCPASDPYQQSAPHEIRVNTRLSCNSLRPMTRRHGGVAANTGHLARSEIENRRQK